MASLCIVYHADSKLKSAAALLAQGDKLLLDQPHDRDNDFARADLLNVHAALLSSDSDFDGCARVYEQVVDIQAFSNEMDSRMIHAGQLAVNQQYFYKLEAETEVKMTDMRQNPPSRNTKAQGSQYMAIPFNVTVQGSFKQSLAFLQRLETGPHFCRFNGVSFTKSGSSAVGADPTGMTMSLNLELLGTP